MQVFLPFPSFAHSVAVLDRARLGKQRIECRQIMTALRAKRNKREVGWINHPATLAWNGFESALGVYFSLSIQEWVRRGYNNTMLPPYDLETGLLVNGEDSYLEAHMFNVKIPDWLGDPAVHASHRSNLLRKDPVFYGGYGWTENDDLEYVWPKPAKEGEEA